MHKLPEPLRAVVDQLTKIPGFGPKSAIRAAMVLLKWPESETMRLGKSIYDLRSKLCLCESCGSLTEKTPCHICSDHNRDSSMLCLVSEWDSLLTIEQGAFYKGQYLILGGLLAPLEHITPEELDLDRLTKRLSSGDITELVLALGATIEAENTASFIKNRVNNRYPEIKVTRLAQGIPLGSEVKSMDSETLRQSMKYRQVL